MRKSIQKDLKFGLDSEKACKSAIEEIVGCKLSKTTCYHSFDYENKEKKIFVELKTRRNKKNAYPTTMIGMNKIEKAIKFMQEGYVVYLAFCFSDQLCYLELNAGYIFNAQIGGRRDRGRAEMKKYAFIPIEDLEDFIESPIHKRISPSSTQSEPALVLERKKSSVVSAL